MTLAAPLGIFGGTFNPPHLGHLRLAEEAREALQLGKVRWIPAGLPPHREQPGVSAAHRLAMTQCAIADNPSFECSDAEVRAAAQGITSYTILTLEHVRAELPHTPLVLLMGADAFVRLPTWHRWQELLAFAHIAIATRPGTVLQPEQFVEPLQALWQNHFSTDISALHQRTHGSIMSFQLTPLDISSSSLRARLAQRQSTRYLLTPAVAHYIEVHRLYQDH